MDKEANAEIRNKLQGAATDLSFLSQNKEVPVNFIRKASESLQEIVELIEVEE